MLSVELPDVEATESLGAALAHEVAKGDLLFLRGELGAGKTSLSRGFVRRFFGDAGLDVPSPSYLLHFTYGGDGAVKVKDGQEEESSAGNCEKGLVPGCKVHHLDPYRLPEGKIASLVDFEKIREGIALVEWPERLGSQLVSEEQPPRLEVSFEGYGPQATGRRVAFKAVGERWSELLKRWESEGGPLRKLPSEAPKSAGSAAPQALGAEQPSQRGRQALPEDVNSWRVLGIESSCDDTGAAVLGGDGKILGEALASQAHIHEKWGGVVPKLAQQGHQEAIERTVEEALKRANVEDASTLTAVAVTVGPGLGLCLEVGVRKALQIAAKHKLPVVPVHHMEGHMMVTRLPSEAAADVPAFPFLTLLVSGGHNMAVLSRAVGNHTILGSTIDDSIGEAFDKTARVLGITKVPGGPHLEKLAKEGDSSKYNLPKPLSKTHDVNLQQGCDWSFSGLKTAVKTLVEKQLVEGLEEEERERRRADIAACFQKVAVKHLCERASRAADWALEMEPEVKSIVVAGGVAANKEVRKGLEEVASDFGLTMRCPPPRLCVDNGVMIAWAGLERLKLGLWEEPPSEAAVERSVEIRPRWPLGARDPRSAGQKLPKGQKRKQPAAERPDAKQARQAEEPAA